MLSAELLVSTSVATLRSGFRNSIQLPYSSIILLILSTFCASPEIKSVQNVANEKTIDLFKYYQ